MSAPQLLSSLRCAAAAEQLDPGSICAHARTPSAPPRPPVPAAGLKHRSAPAPRPGETTGTARPRGAARHRRGKAPSPGPRRRGGSGTRCRHRGTLARSPGRSGGEHVFLCNLFPLSPFAGRPFSGDECPPRYAQRPPLLFPPCCSKLSCQTLMQAVCIRI